MKQLHTILLALLTGLMVATGAFARTPEEAADTARVVIFRFLPGEDLFTLRGNEAELARLSSLVDDYRAEITARRMLLYVDGYCASLPTPNENLRTAFVRANRVKSELIIRKGLTEADFVTGNYPTAYGKHRDVVVVTLHLPAADEPKPAEPVKEQPRQEEPTPADTVTPTDTTVIPTETKTPERPDEVKPQPQRTEPGMRRVQPDRKDDYCFAIRTNLLYDALLLPTLGVEWRIRPDLGIRLDGSLSRWGGATGKVQKLWLLSPELRWYLLQNRRFYVGVSGNYGEYNIYKYPLGSLLKDDTGYQGHLWSAGLSVGYQLRLVSHLGLDFHLGLGYTRSEYDSFTLTDGTRISRRRDCKKNLWGPTQAGITLLWTIGGEK